MKDRDYDYIMTRLEKIELFSSNIRKIIHEKKILEQQNEWVRKKK